MLRSLNKFLLLSIILILSILMLSACGEQKATNEAGPTAAEVTKAPEATPAPEELSKTIKHILGETVIKGTPKRVVALEWTYAEDLLALGIQPIGVTDIKGYKEWVNVKPDLAADVADIGTRQEPNLEMIASLKPDLIIGVAFRHKAIFDKLNAIAPTLIFDPYPAEGSGDQYQEMEQTFSTIGEALDKKAEAKADLEHVQATYTDAAAKLKAANKEGAEYLLVQAFSGENAPALRLFTYNSMAAQILNKISLKNSFKSKVFQQSGFEQTTLEALSAVQKANFFYTQK
jgi:ABC-type Fe3+-citrate transport system substrate-binding protein